MPKPTERAIKRKPMALVFLAWKTENVDPNTEPQDRDFEWFETDKGLDRYTKEMAKHFTKDLEDNEADQVYIQVQVKDTAAMTLGTIEAFPADDANLKKWITKIKKDPSLILAPAAAKKADDGTKKAAPKKTAKPAAKSTETRKATDGGKSTAPKPRKKSAAAKKTVTSEGPDKGSAPQPRAKALKKRLAEKKGSPAEEVAALDQALASVTADSGPDVED